MDWLTNIPTFLSGSVLGAILTIISGWLIKRKENANHATFIALNLAHQFEKYAFECLTVAEDHQNAETSGGSVGVHITNIPKLAKSQEFDFRFFDLAILDKVFDFPQQIEFAENNLSFLFEVATGDEAAEEGPKSCLMLAQKALNIADAIRKKYKLEKRQLKFGEYSVRDEIHNRLEKTKTKV